MKREIKFRAWDVNGQENEQMINSISVEYFTIKEIKSNGFKLMQFTGLYDKNGKEIYEGDILLHNNIKRTVIFEKGAFVLEQKNLTCVREWWNFAKYCEIIGNIYENPELIK